MSNDFQLRKDIDKIDRFVSQLDTAIADKGYEGLDELLEEYGKSLEYLDTLFTDMNTLSTDLKELQDSLIEFNDALINFSDDNTNFASNLSKLKENLNKVLSQMEDIKEGSAEFSDVLDDFGIDISTFVETLWGLNSDLTILSECLDAFMDDLDGFEDALEDAGIDTTGINEDYAKLVWAVGNVRNRTTTAESNIDDLLDDIGDDENFDPSTDTPNGIKQWIAWLQYTIGDDTEGEETGLIASILELSNQIGVDDPNNPTGIFADIATINGDIDYIDGLINGDANHVGILNQINTINNTDIPAVQQGISNYKTAMFGSSTGSESNYTADSIYGRMYAILHKDSNNNEVGRLPTMESNMTSATNRLDALLDTSVTPNTGRIPDLESQASTATSRLDAIYKNTNGTETGMIPTLEGRIDTIDGIMGTDDSSKTTLYNDNTTIWWKVRNALSSITSLTGTLGTNDSSQTTLYNDSTTLWYKIRDITSQIGSNTTGSKTGIYALIDSAVTSISDITTNIIGTINDDVDDGDTTLWAHINQALTSISYAESVIGTNDQYTGADTIWGRIRAYLTRLDNISNTSGTGALDVLEDSVGNDVDYTVDGTLKEQADNSRLALNGILNAVFTDYTPVVILDSEDDIEILLDKTFLDISSGNLPYLFLKNDELKTLLGVSTRFIKIDLTAPKGYTEQTTQVDNCIGVCYDLNDTQVIKNQSSYAMNEPYDVIYEFKTNRFYTIQNNTWTVSDDLQDYFKYTQLNNVISNWVENTSLTGDYHLFTNEVLRMCILYINGVSSGTTSTNSVTTVKTFSATEMPNPPLYNVYSNSSDYNHNIRITTDKKLQVMAGGTTSSISIATQFIWHY